MNNKARREGDFLGFILQHSTKFLYWARTIVPQWKWALACSCFVLAKQPLNSPEVGLEICSLPSLHKTAESERGLILCAS